MRHIVIMMQKKQLLDVFINFYVATFGISYSQHWHFVDFSWFLINIAQYCVNIVYLIIRQTYMEADLCVRRTADVYEQEERSLLNILSVVGSLGTERLHFRTTPAEPANFTVRTASRPAVLLTGIPGRGRGCDVITVPPTGDGAEESPWR